MPTFAHAFFRRKPNVGRVWENAAYLCMEDVYKRLSFDYQNFATFDPQERWAAMKRPRVVYIRTPRFFCLRQAERQEPTIYIGRGLSALLVL